MCGRYYIADNDQDAMLVAYIAEAQGRADRSGLKLVCHGEISPTNIVPIIATSAAHRSIGAFPMVWGFKHPTRDLQVINTRSETATEKPLFCTSIQDRRCLIPATGYFEWKKERNGKKTKYAFSSAVGDPLFIAGLYLRSSEMKIPCFSILTRDATGEIKNIHGRMPVLIPKSKIKEWLSPEIEYTDMLNCVYLDVHVAAV